MQKHPAKNTGSHSNFQNQTLKLIFIIQILRDEQIQIFLKKF